MLQAQLDECRGFTTSCLNSAVGYEKLGISLSKYQQSMFLPLWKAERPSLDLVLHKSCKMCGSTGQAFSLVPKKQRGEAPRFPRFRVFTGTTVFAPKGISLAGIAQTLEIGNIRIRMHRSIEGEIKPAPHAGMLW